MNAIYKKELRSQFNSMIGYIVIAFVLLITGFFFVVQNLQGGEQKFAKTLVVVMVFMAIVVPILTMRSFAEERKSKTDQMLLTYPVSTTNIVLGKFFALLTVVAIPFLIFCTCPLVIKANGTAYLLIDYCTIFSVFMMSGTFIAIGMFISSLTENQVISAVVSFLILLVLVLWDNLVGLIPSSGAASLVGLMAVLAVLVAIIYHVSKNTILSLIVGVAGLAALLIIYNLKPSWMQDLLPTVLSNFSCTAPVYNLASNSIFNINGIFLYVTLTALFLFLTVQTIQKRRWS